MEMLARRSKIMVVMIVLELAQSAHATAKTAGAVAEAETGGGAGVVTGVQTATQVASGSSRMPRALIKMATQ